MYLEDPNHSLTHHVALLPEVHQVHHQLHAMDEGEGFQVGVSLLLCGMRRRSAVDLRPQ